MRNSPATFDHARGKALRITLLYSYNTRRIRNAAAAAWSFAATCVLSVIQKLFCGVIVTKEKVLLWQKFGSVIDLTQFPCLSLSPIP